MNMKQLRLQKGFTYKELSKLTGIAKSTLQRYETGAIQKIPINAIQLIANAFHVSSTVLMGQERYGSNSDGTLNKLAELEPLEKFISSLGYRIVPLTENTALDIIHGKTKKDSYKTKENLNAPHWKITTKNGNTFVVSLAEHTQLFKRIQSLICFELEIIRENSRDDEESRH